MTHRVTVSHGDHMASMFESPAGKLRIVIENGNLTVFDADVVVFSANEGHWNSVVAAPSAVLARPYVEDRFRPGSVGWTS